MWLNVVEYVELQCYLRSAESFIIAVYNFCCKYERKAYKSWVLRLFSLLVRNVRNMTDQFMAFWN
jgi:hypothetical protein